MKVGPDKTGPGTFHDVKLRKAMASPDSFAFHFGQMVRKRRGSQWRGPVCGFYSTDLTPEGYAVASVNEPGNVQIYPVAALEPWDGEGDAV